MSPPVIVTVSGYTGTGKSGVAAEIEVALRALGIVVSWQDRDEMTDARSEINAMASGHWSTLQEPLRVMIRVENQPGPWPKGAAKDASHG